MSRDDLRHFSSCCGVGSKDDPIALQEHVIKVTKINDG